MYSHELVTFKIGLDRHKNVSNLNARQYIRVLHPFCKIKCRKKDKLQQKIEKNYFLYILLCDPFVAPSNRSLFFYLETTPKQQQQQNENLLDI